MLDAIEIKLINKYINRAYPIIKVKFNKRFKRGIEITRSGNSVDVLLSSPTGRNTICDHIIKDVSNVFGINQSRVRELIKDYVFSR